jgi:hypothetical protein
MKTLKRLLVALAAALTLGSGLAVAPAHAAIYNSFTTYSWTGTSCISSESPVIGNPAALTSSTVCPGAGFYQINKTVVQSGQWIGVKIPLSGQNRIECTTWLGPAGGVMSVYATDSADASMGSGEADCLRQVP